jgi:anaerobic selenocysteine-containing dehydrogenase
MILAIGWNGMQSHQMPRAPLVLREFSRDPDRLLVAIDPRRSETAGIADIHLALRPGTDALLARAMISIILAEGWQDRDYIERHLEGFEDVEPWFEGFDTRAALEVCELDYDEVVRLCRLLATRKWCMHTDLGVYMNRHSTAATYLYLLLAALCGRLCVRGGNVIPGHLMPLGAHTDERDPKTWRTAATGFPALMGVFPPNVLPEEIASEGPDRTRAVLCCQSNPLRSYADTSAYEESFGRSTCWSLRDRLHETAPSRTRPALAVRILVVERDLLAWTFPEIYFRARPWCGTRANPSPERDHCASGGRHGQDTPETRPLHAAARTDELRHGAHGLH